MVYGSSNHFAKAPYSWSQQDELPSYSAQFGLAWACYKDKLKLHAHPFPFSLLSLNFKLKMLLEMVSIISHGYPIILRYNLSV